MPQSRRRRVAVAGATGYIGAQCVRLIERHPELDLVQVAARSSTGQRYSQVVPGSGVDLVVDAGIDPAAVDIVFACLPHTVAATAAPAWRAAGALIVDLSADFRLRDAADYEHWYGGAHPAPGLVGNAVYALPELPWTRLDEADILAMPGCFATASLLATVPALAAGIADPEIVIDAKSGVSGAGRSPSLITHFGEANESVRAYSVDGHRHTAEILQELRTAADVEPRLTFVPHLIPMTRGILVTTYLRARDGATRADFEDVYRSFCSDQPCLRFDTSPPPTKSVSGTNVAAVHVAWQNDTAIVTCAIDNLLKGAAGQAIQALNLRMEWPETTAIELVAAWP